MIRTILLLLVIVFIGIPAVEWTSTHNLDGSPRKYTTADGDVVYYSDPLGPNAPIPAPGSPASAFHDWAAGVCAHWMQEPDDYRKGAGCHIDKDGTTEAHAVYDPTPAERDKMIQKAEDNARKVCDRLEHAGYTCTEIDHD